ncbi:MAG: hypothetical protein K2Q17_07475 [Nitrospiraceae bacterium]|nr:hypothetical protein [Nitrospiraceae bacterium]
MSGNPLLGVTRDTDKGFEVIEIERSPVAPCSGLILERAGEGRCEEQIILADILPDRRFDVAGSQRVRGFVVGSHLVLFVEMKLALSQEEESQPTVHIGNLRQGLSPACREGQATGVTLELARAVRLIGDSRSATDGGYHNTMGYGAIKLATH